MLTAPFDMTYLILVVPTIIFSMWAQHMVTSNFKKYSAVRTSRGMTGADAAQQVLNQAGITNVRIERIQGKLTDHFDPRDNVIRLSESVHDVPSVAAVGVAAHEAGHAIQYDRSYFPMKIRSAIIPMTNIGSKLSMPLVIIGMIFSFPGLINIGIILFGAVVLFQLITLPVEFNASRRAINVLSESQLLSADEVPAARKVLSAAALTYVGALAVSLAQLVRLIMMTQRRR